MLNKIVLGVALVGLVLASSPTVWANCSERKIAADYNPVTYAYAYWYANDVGQVASATLLGQTWQLGSYGTWNDRGQGRVPALHRSA